MARSYVVRMDRVSVSTAKTLIQIKAGTASGFAILRAWCSITGTVSDAQQTIQINRKSAAATVTSFTPLLLTPGDAAAKAVGGTSATGTDASAEGTDSDILLPDGFNLRVGWLYVPVPEEREIIDPGSIIGLKFPVAPGSAIVVTAGIKFMEFS